MPTPEELDPRGLIREAYRIEGITIWDCRSVFLDWALGRDPGDLRPEIEFLLTHYGAEAPTHPMTEVLKAGLIAPQKARRRGGRAGRTKG